MNKFVFIGITAAVLVSSAAFASFYKTGSVSQFLAFLSGAGLDNSKNEFVRVSAQPAKNQTADNSLAKETPPVKECSFKADQNPAHNGLIFKEIAWMGDKDSPNNEWFAVQKISSGDLDISGYEILNQKERIKVRMPQGTVLNDAKPRYVLARKAGLTGADLIFSGAIGNTNEGLRLFDRDCRLLDEAFANPDWPAGDNDSKETMQRDLATFAWYAVNPAQSAAAPPEVSDDEKVIEPASATSAAPIPANIAIKDAPAAAVHTCPQNNLGAPTHEVLINEVAWAGVSSDKTAREWIELKNPKGSLAQLAGWQLLNKSAAIKISFPAKDAIAGNGFYLLERGYADTIPGIKADKIFAGAIKNNDESLRLFDNECRLVDEVVAAIGKDKNWPAGTAGPDYRTAERLADFSWQTYAGGGQNGIMGTPHNENSASPPPVYYTVFITKAGSGAGTVSDSSGINCGPGCNDDSEDYLEKTSLTFSASAAANSTFDGWSGACSGTESCELTIDGAKSVTAVFTRTAVAAAAGSPDSGASISQGGSAAGTASTSIRSDGTSGTSTSTGQTNPLDHLLISEVMAGKTANASYEFVEFYNPTSAAADLTDWYVRKKSSSGTESDLVVASRLKGKSIPAGKHLLLANTSSTLSADVLWPASYTLAYKNNAVTLYDKNGAPVDAVSWIEIPADKSYARAAATGDFAISDPTPQGLVN